MPPAPRVVHVAAQDFCSAPTITMGEVGWAEPASGSTVIAAALTVPPVGHRDLLHLGVAVRPRA